jgi:predicted NAD/FAD-dependent oxidoreductase
MSAGRDLARSGHEIVVFDKARGVGGRMPTRRHETGTFDHGAQYLTARSESFRDQVRDWCERGLAARWEARIVRLARGRVDPEAEPTPRYVGVPKMSVLARDLGRDLEIHCNEHVVRIERRESGWSLETRAEAAFDGFDAVLLATPAAQTLPLLPKADGLAPLRDRIERVVVDPCQAVLATFARPLPVDFEAAFIVDSPLGWVARNNSKPGRPADENWVLHGTPEWSRTHVETAPGEVARALVASLEELLDRPLPETRYRGSHRWLYARTRVSGWAECVWNANSGIGLCGDWLLGNRIEDAFLSGRALAREIAR